MQLRAHLDESLQVALRLAGRLAVLQTILFLPAIATSAIAVVWLSGHVAVGAAVAVGLFITLVTFVAHALSAVAIARLVGEGNIGAGSAVRFAMTHLSRALAAMMPTYAAAALVMGAVGGYGAAVAWGLLTTSPRLTVVALGGAVVLMLMLAGASWLATTYAIAPAMVGTSDGKASAAGRHAQAFTVLVLSISVWTALVTLGSLVLPTPDLGGLGPRDIARVVPILLAAQGPHVALWLVSQAVVTAFTGVVWARWITDAE